MEGVEHKMVSVNGITMHIAEKGPKEGPVVLFLHGFPGLWYTWRHQMGGLSSAGYRTVAPDLRGYGDTDSPAAVSEYSCLHVVGDIVALLDSLGSEDRVFVVGHDWGAIVGWYLCLFRPEKVKAFVCLSVPYRPRNPQIKPVDGFRAFFGEDYYICRFQEPGKIEGEIASWGRDKVLRKILTDRTPGPPFLPKDNPFGINPNPNCQIELPVWLSEDDLSFYVCKFQKTGFTGGLNYYRAMDLSWELTAPWTGSKVQIPVKFITGDLDCVYTTPGMKEYVQSGAFTANAPNLQEIVVMEGVGHFINEEKPQEINAHISDFFAKFLDEN